ncbi:MAG: hypothetical protein ACOY3P_02455 [Planctomycetota bacterium]
MKLYAIILAVVAVLLLTATSGLIHGEMSGRWAPNDEFQHLAARIEHLPTEFGHWHMEKETKLSALAARTLECAGNTIRQYRSSASGALVTATVMLGPAGPLSAHRPDICLSVTEYEVGEPESQAIETELGRTDEFLRVIARSRLVGGDTRVAWYSWSSGSNWSAPSHPRFAFVGMPYLYKLQVDASIPPGVNPNEVDPCAEFLKQFVPVLQAHLLQQPETEATLPPGEPATTSPAAPPEPSAARVDDAG